MNQNYKKPLISLILPISQNEEDYLIDKCLHSVRNQTFSDFEMIVVTDRSVQSLEKFKKKYPFIQIYYSPKNKSGARNLGSEKSTGQYLFHLDCDIVLENKVLAECAEKIKEQFETLIIPERANPILGFWTKCRDLEKRIYIDDPIIEAPRVIKKELFEKLNGFDESLDPLDEWGLYLKINRAGIKIGRIKNLAWMNRKITIPLSIMRKYQRGRLSNPLKKQYPEAHFTNLNVRLKSFTKNLPALLKNPLLSFGLLILKFVELVAFSIGSKNPSPTSQNLQEFFDQEANQYENIHYLKTQGARLVDKKEKELVLDWLKKYLPPQTEKVLDLGCGSGRWSKFILDNFDNVSITGLDLSSKMLKLAAAKIQNHRFQTFLSSTEKQEFPENSFDCLLNIRALKYSGDYGTALKKSFNILKPGGLLILEVPYANPLAVILKMLSFFLRSKQGFLGYFRKITLFSQKKIIQSLEQAHFEILEKKFLFKWPSTLYANTDSEKRIKLYQNLEKLLPSGLFGRSLFIVAQKPKPLILKNKPLVSVIINCRNSQKTIEDLLISVKKQTHVNWEIIVVDNNSADQTKKIAEKYTKSVFNLGPERSPQKNFGASKARGEWLLFLDSDMILNEEVISTCLAKIETNSNLAAIIIPEVSRGQGFWANSLALERSCYLGDDLIESPRFILKQLFEKLGGFDENLIAAEDWDLGQRIKDCAQVGRIKAFIAHQEGRVSLIGYLRKKYYYAKHFPPYLRKNPKFAILQMNLIFRRAFFRNWKKLARDPVHTLGFLSLKFLESIVGLVAYLKKSRN